MAFSLGTSGPFDFCLVIAVVFLVVFILCLTNAIHLSMPSTAYIFLVLAIVFFCVFVFFRFMRKEKEEDPMEKGMMPPPGGMPIGPPMTGGAPFAGAVPPVNVLGPGAPPMIPGGPMGGPMGDPMGGPMSGPAEMDHPGIIPPQQSYGPGIGMQPGMQPAAMGRPPVGSYGPGYV